VRALERVTLGRVYLVGAGILGKMYCDVIKQRGGVAIDIGAVIDGWARRGLPYAVRQADLVLAKFGHIPKSEGAGETEAVTPELAGQTD